LPKTLRRGIVVGVGQRYWSDGRTILAILAGIDEAGLGPILGPLVMCASVFEVPDELADQPLWDTLAPAVIRKPGRKSTALAIGDSKKLFKRKSPKGLRHLERAVLATLACGDDHPATLAELLSIISPDANTGARNYPWYNLQDVAVPGATSATDISFSGNALSVAMKKAGARMLDLRAECVFVGEFNRIIRATGNKSTTALGVTFRLIHYIFNRLESGFMQIHVDRQGGRMRYLSALERAFEGCSFKILQEDPDCSEYEMSDARRTARITFSVGGEARHMPIALASMTAKYLRELFMERFNKFWAQHVEDIAPTAGYYTDGRRFYGQIKDAMATLGIDEDLVYRCR
jgi:ribonuclease HII